VRIGGQLRRVALAAGIAWLGGCGTAPPQPAPLPQAPDVSGIHAFLRSHHAEDARFQSVADRPYLKVDLRLRYELDAYPASGATTAQREFIATTLEHAAAVGERAVSLALAWVNADELAAWNRAHGVPAGADPRAAAFAAYRDDSRARLRAELGRVRALADAAAVSAYWSAFTAAIEESIMTRGRLARKLLNAPAVPFINGWIAYHNRHDYRGPRAPKFADAITFRPDPERARPFGMERADWRLLQRYAPIVVQERSAQPAYPGEYDRFGRVALRGEQLDTALPAVDTDVPTVYAYIDRKRIQGVEVRQLNYTIWYPRHPAMSLFDPEAGALDGWTVRISLDQADRPRLVESVSNCGCYYKIFPGAALEAESRAAYGDRLAGKTLYIEGHVTDGVDAVVPETIPGLETATYGITLYMSAGHHQLVTIRAHAPSGDIPGDNARPYLLAAYDELEQLPFHDRRASLFATDGLVREAHRRECVLLSPSGLYHAGHPRQRETQMIYFDEANLDDPGLLERYLRLPPRAFGPGA